MPVSGIEDKMIFITLTTLVEVSYRIIIGRGFIARHLHKIICKKAAFNQAAFLWLKIYVQFYWQLAVSQKMYWMQKKRNLFLCQMYKQTGILSAAKMY